MIDVLRVGPDGTTTLAGRTEAGAALQVLVDGVAVASLAADASGQFAGLFTLPPSDAPRMLTLLATLANGTPLPSADSVAIAPVALAATEAPATLKITENGAEVLQAAPPAEATAEAVATEPAAEATAEPAVEPAATPPVAQVTLDAITYTASGAVQLGGKGEPGAVLRLYLDNVEMATATVHARGQWSLTSNDIAPGALYAAAGPA